MTDRNVEFPNRYRLVKVPGTDDIVDIIPAPGTVYDEGTFYNKANQLSDKTAAAIGGLPDDPTVNDALAGINDYIKISPETLAFLGGAKTLDEALTALGLRIGERVRLETGNYVGTGNVGTKQITFSFVPRIWGFLGRDPSTDLDFTQITTILLWGVGAWARITTGLGSSDFYNFNFKFNGKTVSWVDNYGNDHNRALNEAQSIYYYFAIG